MRLDKTEWQELSLKARKELGGTLQRMREDAHLTQQELADAIGTGVRTIGKAECGEGNPEFDTLFRIVRYLHISGDAVFYPEILRREAVSEFEETIAYRQLQAHISSCSEQEILLLNSITESTLRVLRCKDLK